MGNRIAGMYGDWTLSFRDAGNEVGVLSGTGKVVFGTNEDSNITTQKALFDTFVTKIQAVVLGNLEKREYLEVRETVIGTPTNGAARELKLLIIYECTVTGKRYRMSVPTLNPTIPVYVQNVSVKDAVRVDTPAAITELVTAFNAFVVAPDIPADITTGVYAVDPACTVKGFRVVGRTN